MNASASLLQITCKNLKAKFEKLSTTSQYYYCNILSVGRPSLYLGACDTAEMMFYDEAGRAGCWPAEETAMSSAAATFMVFVAARAVEVHLGHGEIVYPKGFFSFHRRLFVACIPRSAACSFSSSRGSPLRVPAHPEACPYIFPPGPAGSRVRVSTGLHAVPLE